MVVDRSAFGGHVHHNALFGMNMKMHSSTQCLIEAVTFVLITLVCLNIAIVHASETSGTITGGANVGYAWSNQIGWINFGCDNCNVHVTDAGITGYGWNDAYGWINLSPDTGGISVADDGSLSGGAWGESTGWIYFSGVSISSVGEFTGQATGDGIGILTFDCNNCSVTTDYIPHDFRDTQEPATSSGGGGGGGGGFSYEDATGTTTEQSAELAFHSTTSEFTNGETNTLPIVQPQQERTNGDDGAKFVASKPKQLFDINVTLDDTTIARLEDLVARIHFESFGTEPTPVAVTFLILSSDGAVIHRDTVDSVVETVGVLTKEFPERALPHGTYTLVVEAQYDVDTVDQFRQSFTVHNPLDTDKTSWYFSVVVLSIVIVLLFFSRRGSR